MNNFDTKKYNVCVSTNVGKVRSANEDNFTINNIVRSSDKKNQNIKGSAMKEPLLCAVFDGMGGENSGEEASAISALIASEFYDYLSSENAPINKCIYSYVDECSNEILNILQKKKAKRGGSTMTMAYCNNGVIQTFSLGDSRIYLYSNGNLSQISNDHTLAMKKYHANIYTLQEARESSDKHKLTAFLGLEKENQKIKVENYDNIILGEGDKLLLCSDGLYDMVSDAEICNILSGSSNKMTMELVNRALINGGEDNVTCMIIESTN